MVNKERVKKKLPELLSEGSLTVRPNFYAYRDRRDQIRKIERKKPGWLDKEVKKLVDFLEELERRMDRPL
jgi:hypothetical protein